MASVAPTEVSDTTSLRAAVDAGAGVGAGAGSGSGATVAPASTTAAPASTTASGQSARKSHKVEIATADDIPEVADLQAQAFEAKFRHVGLNLEQGAGLAEEDYRLNAAVLLPHMGVVRDDKGSVLGACQLQLPGDKKQLKDMNERAVRRIVGGCCLMFRVAKLGVLEGHACKANEAYVTFIAVHAKGRGKGLGTTLLTWADSFAKEHGCTHITLAVMISNRAQGLYLRHGYEETSRSGCCGSCCMNCLVGEKGYIEMRKDFK